MSRSARLPETKLEQGDSHEHHNTNHPRAICCAGRAAGRRTLVMVDLLKFKTPGGLESYQRYGREVAPHLERVGATVRYAGTSPAFVIGDSEKPWWDASYRRVPDTYGVHRHGDKTGIRQVHQHRAAGLERGDLIATSVWSVTVD